MRTILILFSLILWAESSLAKIEAVLGSIPLKENANIVAMPRVSSKEVIISREQYVISYNKERRSPNWVAWKVTADNLGTAARTNRFEQDKELQNYLGKIPNAPPAVTPDDYRGSCFDRGHQAPSADRTNSVENNQSTFMMSNMLPQTPYLNRVVWMHLEQHTRDLVLKQGKTAYIVAGPIYDLDFGKIGPKNDIQVPSKNFKVIVLLDQGQTPADINDQTEMIAVIMPNLLEDGSRPDQNKDALCNSSAEDQRGGRSNDWEQYKSTVSDIQKLSGVTLFPK